MIDIISYSAAESPVGKLAAILDRRDGQPADVEAAVQEILRQVRASGDDAVVEYTSRFDGVTMTPQSMRVSAKALADAGEAMDPALLAAVRAAAANIRAFHLKQHTNSWFTEDGDGVILGKRVTPLRRVGICVPGGQAPLISSLLMAAIPAQVAGVEEICVVTPRREGGCRMPRFWQRRSCWACPRSTPWVGRRPLAPSLSVPPPSRRWTRSLVPALPIRWRPNGRSSALSVSR